MDQTCSRGFGFHSLYNEKEPDRIHPPVAREFSMEEERVQWIGTTPAKQTSMERFDTRGVVSSQMVPADLRAE